jgi:endothelin-converting enzyme
VYRKVIERLLLSLADEDEESSLDQQQPSLDSILVQTVKWRIWPPWPWPPWDGDGDDDDDDKKPVNQTERARKLSREVLKFETRLANASLDL